MSPRHRDLYPALALILAACAAAATEIRSNDLWWHLATGRWILENHMVPAEDPFTFTSAGTAWVDHGWLWQVAAALLHSAGGLGWLALLKVGSASLFAVAAFFALRRSGRSAHLSAAVALLCLAGARFRFADRPEAAGLALLALFLYLLVAPNGSPRMRVAGMAATCLVWANIHASVLVAPLLAALACAGSLAAAARAGSGGEKSASEHRLRALHHAVAGVVAAAALLANPYGYRLLLVPLRLKAALADPRLLNPEWPPPELRDFPFFYAALALALAAAVLRIARGIDPSTWRGLLMAGATGSLALGSVRHVGLFFVTLPFALAASGRPWPAPEGPLAPLPASWSPAWGVAGAILFLAVPAGSVAAPGLGLEPGRFPVSEVDYLEQGLEAPRRLYNEVAHGGYLIWRLYPGDRVFIDGRNEVHEDLLKETAGSIDDGRAWQAFLDRHRVQGALVRYREERIPVTGASEGEARTFAPLHFPRSRWALVHWGDTAMVFLRRGGAHQERILGDEYPAVDPEDWRHQLDRCKQGDRALTERVLSDLRRRVAARPPSRRARELLARFSALAEE